jgi:NitT/TauT family transport system substrate-binding protein
MAAASQRQVSDFFVAEAGVTTAIRAADYFDSGLYLATVN